MNKNHEFLNLSMFFDWDTNIQWTPIRQSLYTLYFLHSFPKYCLPYSSPWHCKFNSGIVFSSFSFSLFAQQYVQKYLQTAQGHTLRVNSKLKILNITSTLHFIRMVMRHFTKHYEVPYVDGQFVCNNTKVRDEQIIKTNNFVWYLILLTKYVVCIYHIARYFSSKLILDVCWDCRQGEKTICCIQQTNYLSKAFHKPRSNFHGKIGV